MMTSTSQQPQQSTQLSPTGLEVFSKAVRYILTEWPSLQLAIENGMGGSQSREKLNWMIGHIIEIMVKGKDIDLENYLAEIVNQEFDTLIEDGSLEYNTQWINKFLKDCLQGKEKEVLDSINGASAKKLSLGNMKIPPPVNATQQSSDDDDDEGEDDGDF